MIEPHLTASDFDDLLHGACAPLDARKVHLITCPACTQELDHTRKFESLLKLRSKPALGFDLVALIIPQLESEAPEKNRLVLIAQALIGLALILILAACIYFKEYFTVFRIRFNDSLTPLIILSGVFYITWQVMDLFISYRKKLIQFNIS